MKFLAAEHERRVIGSFMRFGHNKQPVTQEALLLLNADCFVMRETRRMFEYIQDAAKKNKPFMWEDLCDANFDNETWTMLQEIQLAGYTKNLLIHDANVLCDLKVARKRFERVSDAIGTLNQNTPEQSAVALNEALSDALSMNRHETVHGHTNEKIIDEILLGNDPGNKLLKTGVDTIDSIAGGIHSRQLITIAGGSGVGKSYFGIYLMHLLTNIMPDRQALYFDFEMTPQQIIRRYVACAAGKRSAGEIDFNYNAHLGLKRKITVFEPVNTTIEYIETMCKIKSAVTPLSCVVVDYLTLVTSAQRFERHDLTQKYISSILAKIATELDTVVIALSQVNRDNSKRRKNDRIAYPSDAADSSGSERSSGLWLGIDRPKLRYEMQDDPFLVAARKNRFGELYQYALDFNAGAFGELEFPFNFEQYQAKEDQKEFVI